MTDDRRPAEEPFEPIDGIRLIASWARHRQFVEEGVHLVTAELERRAIVHDASKMLADEFAGFSRINAHARIHKFGSEEYRGGMLLEAATVQQHYLRNSHHAEHYDVCLRAGAPALEMDFLDVIEMVCDWWGARKGYDDGKSWMVGVEANLAAKDRHLKLWQVELARSVAAYLDGTGRA